MRNLYPALKFSFYLIIFNCFIISSSFSQELGSAFGKPKKSDITLTQYDPEPEAEALVLLKTKSISYKYDFQISQTINHFQRIKIFKESAYEYGEVLIEYYHSSGFESIEKLNAMITYSDGSRRILDEDHITHKELDDEWAQVLLKFPNMQPGSIIEYEYTLKKNYFSAPDDFVFQSEIPLQYAFLSYDIPASIKYNFLTQGNKYIEAEGNAFAMANVPSIHEDVFITTMDDYVGKIETRVQSYYETDYASLEVNPTAEIMIKRLLRDRLFGAQYSKSIYNSKVVSDAKEVLEEEIPLLNKIDKLQDLLLQKVVWDGSMEVKCRKSINKLYREGRAARN